MPETIPEKVVQKQPTPKQEIEEEAVPAEDKEEPATAPAEEDAEAMDAVEEAGTKSKEDAGTPRAKDGPSLSRSVHQESKLSVNRDKIVKDEVDLDEENLVVVDDGGLGEDDLDDLVRGDSPGPARESIARQSSIRTASEADDEYTKMIVRQALDERLKDFEENMQKMMDAQAASAAMVPDPVPVDEDIMKALEARIEAVQLELEQKLVHVTTKLKIMNLMVSSHRDKKEAKKKDDDPNYDQFSSSLRSKIESAGDEKSKNLLEKLLKQLARSGANNEEVIQQLELLGGQLDRQSASTTRRGEHPEVQEPKVATVADIKMNRKLIRRQFYAEDEGAAVGPHKEKDATSQYQKLVDDNKKLQEPHLEYEQRVQAAAKGYGLSEAANSIIHTAYRGQKTVQSLFLNNRGQVVNSPQTGQKQARSSADPSGERDGRNSNAFSFPSVEAAKSSKPSPPQHQKLAAKRSLHQSITHHTAGIHRTIDTTRNLAPLPSHARQAPPGTAGHVQRPTHISDPPTAAGLSSRAGKSSERHPLQFNSTRHQRRSGHQSVVQNTDRSKFEPLNF